MGLREPHEGEGARLIEAWLLPVGLALYGLGAFLQIAEEWRERGLTDTSYTSLACLAVGPALVALWALGAHSAWVAAATALPAALAAGLFLWKLRYLIRTKLRI